MEISNHLVVTSTGECFELHCLHCGAKVQIKLPVALDDYLVLSEAYTNKHRRCPEPVKK